MMRLIILTTTTRRGTRRSRRESRRESRTGSRKRSRRRSRTGRRVVLNYVSNLTQGHQKGCSSTIPITCLVCCTNGVSSACLCASKSWVRMTAINRIQTSVAASSTCRCKISRQRKQGLAFLRSLNSLSFKKLCCAILARPKTCTSFTTK